jgi:hypothetical protein
MRKNIREWLLTLCLSTSFLFLNASIVLAEGDITRKGFEMGGYVGYGLVNVKTDNFERGSYGTFALGFQGGYAVTPSSIIGLEVNGWTLKAYNYQDPSEGESVSNISLFLNYFPLNTVPLYISFGGGQVSYTNNSPGVDGRDKGVSWFLGSGYELSLASNIMMAPQIRYSQGNITDGNFGVLEFSIGMHWYENK